MQHKQIDFADLAAGLLSRAETLLPQWLPGGKRVGHEYVCHSLSGGEGGRVSVNLTKGCWADFAGDEAGGDLISLYAAIRGLKQSHAARELQGDLGWQAEAPAPVEPKTAKRRTMWAAQPSAPVGAPEPELVWSYRDEAKDGKPWVKLTAVASWAYRRDDVLHGYVARFERVDSKGEKVKETLPLTWCIDESDGQQTARWKWQQWQQPRPLFLASGRSIPAAAMVVVVEGEKCAAKLHAVIGSDTLAVVSWPGGCKVWERADWSWIPAGARVVLWPDADSKHEPLSRQQRDMGMDPDSTTLMPALKQPGMKAMLGIGGLLDRGGCKVRVCVIPGPGQIADGWDCADAIDQDGWDAGRLGQFLADAVGMQDLAVLYAADPSPRARGGSLPAQAGEGVGSAPAHTAAGISPPSRGFAGGGDDGDDDGAWRERLIWRKGELVDCRENIFLILAHHPGLAGTVAYDEFAARVTKLKPMPWGGELGEWSNQDDYSLGLWLAETCGLVVRGEGTLVAGVAMAAHAAKFHPVRAYLDALVWDGMDRLDHWLHECLSCSDIDYHRMVGRWFLMGMVSRIYQPGCQMDNMLILEGLQGRRKSTALRTISRGWFADTPIRIGDKDALLNLAGVWLYEVAELDSFSKAEVTAVKQYVTSRVDRVREPFARRAVDRPRSCVLGGTTNQSEYFKDPTGSRRFWPVTIQGDIDLDKLDGWMDQLYAEAIVRVRRGERYYPTREEVEQYIEPQQEAREISDPWFERLAQWLEDGSSFGGKHKQESNMVAHRYTVQELLRLGLGVPVDRIDGGRQMATRVGVAMHKLGWRKDRESTGARLWYYVRPGYTSAGALIRSVPASGLSSNLISPSNTPSAWLDDVTR